MLDSFFICLVNAFMLYVDDYIESYSDCYHALCGNVKAKLSLIFKECDFVRIRGSVYSLPKDVQPKIVKFEERYSGMDYRYSCVVTDDYNNVLRVKMDSMFNEIEFRLYSDDKLVGLYLRQDI